MSKEEIKLSMILIPADFPGRFSNADKATKRMGSKKHTEIVTLLVKLYIQPCYLRGIGHL